MADTRNKPAPTGEITPEDLKLAEGMVKDGIELPPDLKTAYDAHKAKTTPPAGPAGEPKTPPEPKKTGEGEGKKDDEGKPGTVEPPEPRGVKTVPLAKYLDTEKELKRYQKLGTPEVLERQLTALPQKSDEDYEKEVGKLAEKLGLEAEQVKELDTFFAKRHKLPDEVLAAITEAKNIKEQESFWDKQFARFEDEFSADLEDVKKTDSKEADEMEKHKEEIKNLAFTEGYNTKSAWELWTRFVKPKLEPNKKTVETGGSGGVGGSGGGRDWSKIANDPMAIRNLSPKEFEEFDKWLMATAGGVIMRPAKKI